MTDIPAVGDDLHALAVALLGDVMATLEQFPASALNASVPGYANTAYTLAYHLLGSARYWIGEVVGKQPTERVRAEEFGTSGTLDTLRGRYLDTLERVENTFAAFSERNLQPRPIDLSRGVLSWGELPPQGRTDIWVLGHDLAHIAYHLGQLKLLLALQTADERPSGKG